MNLLKETKNSQDIFYLMKNESDVGNLWRSLLDQKKEERTAILNTKSAWKWMIKNFIILLQFVLIYSKIKCFRICSIVLVQKAVLLSKQIYWNHTSVWLFSCKFAAYFQKVFSWEHYWRAVSVSRDWERLNVTFDVVMINVYSKRKF